MGLEMTNIDDSAVNFLVFFYNIYNPEQSKQRQESQRQLQAYLCLGLRRSFTYIDTSKFRDRTVRCLQAQRATYKSTSH